MDEYRLHGLCMLLLLMAHADYTRAKLYTYKERDNLACHRSKNATALRTDAKLKEIDDTLDAMYTELNTTGVYKDDCVYSIAFNFKFLKNGNTPEEVEVTETLTDFMEATELLRDRYDQGLWGYCADEGADELIENITLVTKAIKDWETKSKKKVVVCDRNKLLACHPVYNLCVCATEKRSYRRIAGDFNQDTKKCEIASEDFRGDCPISSHAKREGVQFECRVNERCLIKEAKSRKNKDVNCTKQNFKKLYKVDIDDAQLTHSNAKYRYTRNDYPSPLCQCYTSVGDTKGASEEKQWVQVFGAVIIHLVFYYM